MIYIISDLHFSHTNIIKYCNRPFSDAHEMNKVMTERWNSVVKPEDTVIVVGDFALTNVETQKTILAKLNGTKILVQGNHDKNPQAMLQIGFSLVVDSMILKDSNGEVLFFTHHPLDIQRETILDNIGADYHVHGHVHNKTPLYHAKRSINVSCENLDYTPIELNKLVARYKACALEQNNE